MRYLMLAFLLPLAGCSLTPSSDFVNALANDPATVCLRLSSVYEQFTWWRTNIKDGNVSCNSDGMSVKSNGAMIGVPITVVPQISVSPAVSAPQTR